MALLGEGFVLKVNTQELETKADAASQKITNMAAAFESMKSAVDRMQQYWQGEASDLHHKAYAEKEEMIDVMIKRLQEHPTDLLKMAGVYRETEQTNTDASAPLLDNVIS